MSTPERTVYLTGGLDRRVVAGGVPRPPGIEGELIERDPEWTTTDGRITLYPKGMRTLGALGAAHEVEAVGTVLDRFRIVTWDGRRIAEVQGPSNG